MGFAIADCEAAVGSAAGVVGAGDETVGAGTVGTAVGAGAGVGGSGSSPPEHARNIAEAKAAATAKTNNTLGEVGLFMSGVARFLIHDSGKDSA